MNKIYKKKLLREEQEFKGIKMDHITCD
jgi:hypothetical protein